MYVAGEGSRFSCGRLDAATGKEIGFKTILPGLHDAAASHTGRAKDGQGIAG